jgi:uncharacterized membrane protein (DUF373 family)
MANRSSSHPSNERGPREWITTVFNWAEDFVYIGLGILLAASAITLLFSEFGGLTRTLLSGPFAENVVPLLDQLLLVIIIVELLFTVKISFREHVLEPQPFLIVATIAVSRRIIVLTAELSKLLKEDEKVFQHALIELAVLTILALTLVLSLRLLKPREHKVES